MNGEQPTHADIRADIGKVHGRLDALFLGQSQLQDGVGRMGREVGELHSEVKSSKAVSEANSADIKRVDHRVRTLELTDARDAGARSTWETLLKSPALPWLFMLAIAVWTALGQPKP